eukprot:3076494-Prymnesium_polylepis.1
MSPGRRSRVAKTPSPLSTPASATAQGENLHWLRPPTCTQLARPSRSRWTALREVGACGMGSRAKRFRRSQSKLSVKDFGFRSQWVYACDVPDTHAWTRHSR